MSTLTMIFATLALAASSYVGTPPTTGGGSGMEDVAVPAPVVKEGGTETQPMPKQPAPRKQAQPTDLF